MRLLLVSALVLLLPGCAIYVKPLQPEKKRVVVVKKQSTKQLLKPVAPLLREASE